MIAIMGEWFTKEKRGTVFGMWLTSQNVGLIIGASVSKIGIKNSHKE